ncbi:MAG TPA: hypothetical protein VNZ55_00430, partial [Thermomicrobiales bacterium]|nr:hypothetical protein [Thermomicrobiales bacterium]
VVEQSQESEPWSDHLAPIIDRFSTNREFRPYDLIHELEQRNLFTLIGREQTAVYAFVQSVADYVESFHARNGFSRQRMAPDAAAAFDHEVTTLVAPHAEDGNLTLHIRGAVT